jgi:hypothetical protein
MLGALWMPATTRINGARRFVQHDEIRATVMTFQHQRISPGVFSPIASERS